MTRWQAILAAIIATEGDKVRTHLTGRRVAWASLASFVIGSIIADIIGERKRVDRIRTETLADLSSRADEIASRRDRMIAGETNARTDAEW